MNLILFSFNRALQLEVLLRTLTKHLLGHDFEISVLYNSSGGDYELAYEQLKQEYPNVKFIRRKKIDAISFKYFFTYKKNIYRYFKHKNLREKLTNFKELLEQILQNSKYPTVAFFTDDSMFCRDIEVSDDMIKKIANDTTNTLVYSLRHGLNIENKPADITTYDNENSVWNVDLSKKDIPHWTYLFSIDGHIYKRDFLLPIIKKLNFVNPNSFEGFVNNYIETERKGTLSKLVFPNHSALIGFELNQVQSFVSNNNHNFSVEDLNKKFLEGYRLTYLYDDNQIGDFRPELKGIQFSKANGETEVINF